MSDRPDTEASLRWFPDASSPSGVARLIVTLAPCFGVLSSRFLTLALMAKVLVSFRLILACMAELTSSITPIVFFTGGDQLRITSILGGSPVLKEVRRRYFEEFCIVAGTSAGASAMPETMIYGGESSEALLKGTVHMTGGIGLIGRVIIDSHFIKRGRFSRLMQIVSLNPGHIGLGLGEDTGIVIERGRFIKAIGSGLVVIFDGQDLRYTNITEVSEGEAIAIENIRVHTIVRGYGYDLKERRYLKPTDMESLDLACK